MCTADPRLYQVARLQAHLSEETKQRQQAERQLLDIQHGFLPATSPQGSPLPVMSAHDTPLLHGSHKVRLLFHSGIKHLLEHVKR